MLLRTWVVWIAMCMCQVASAESPYEVDGVRDGVLTGAGALLLVLSDGFVKRTMRSEPACALSAEGLCDPSRLDWPDRTVVGNASEVWRTVSDIGLYGAFALTAGLQAVDVFGSSKGSWGEYGTDMLVMHEALVVSGLMTSILKYAVRRPRPSQYSNAMPGRFGMFEHQLSFPSGHTSAAAALTTSYAATFGLRHPNSPWRWAVYGLAAFWTGMTAQGRVGAGMHFYTDVLAGAVLGAACGVLVPWMHRRGVSLQPTSLGEMSGQNESPLLVTLGMPF